MHRNVSLSPPFMGLVCILSCFRSLFFYFCFSEPCFADQHLCDQHVSSELCIFQTKTKNFLVLSKTVVLLSRGLCVQDSSLYKLSSTTPCIFTCQKKTKLSTLVRPDWLITIFLENKAAKGEMHKKIFCPESTTHTGTNLQLHWDGSHAPSHSVGSLSISLYNNERERSAVGPLWSCISPRPPPHGPKEWRWGGGGGAPAGCLWWAGLGQRVIRQSPVCSAPCQWFIFQER